ncbi:hypothetical protein Q6A51_26215 [Pseudomonas sp. KFB-139]|uniref:Uncharacterized protein n=1 Tax=Pseudomonas serbiensis TaxID=3064350 RepID=A0ABT9CXP4_9PSED|nr:hypothetical protein [Pseudomonas sp. KFB-138]MDO7930269.1 hypothetical protein [Pseudomonas sp. KFB-138]
MNLKEDWVMLRFVNTTVASGVMFILPLILICILLEKALQLMHKAAAKALPMLETYSVAGLTLLTIIAIVALVFLFPSRTFGPDQSGIRHD